ncbi:RHS repeat-associated core domain-containing protein [Chryseobacterium sp. NRRL B-14859]|uniref:RHS repeat-associated core domain-containing protein n=1 Tax=Chryseobacterium sp. NRRL B-14859 TaxID=1562763 RepID=UPI0033996FDA
MEYVVFLNLPFGETMLEQMDGSYNNPYKFNAKELDEDTGLYYYGARYYNPRLSIWYGVDPLGENMPSWSPYVYTFDNPVRFIDPTGMEPVGDYYTKLGKYLGSDGKNDNKVYVADGKTVSKNNDGTTSTTFNNAKELSITHSEFQKQAATVYGESSAYRSGTTEELAMEMGAIASVHQTNKVAYGVGSAQAKSFLNTDLEDRTGKMQLANWAVINAVTGGKDYSNGASNWDGLEQARFPDSDKRYSTGTWELHKNTIGWNISDSHYNKWKSHADERGYKFEAPATSYSVPGTYMRGGRGIKITGGQTGFQSTAVYGGTIFWKKTK